MAWSSAVLAIPVHASLEKSNQLKHVHVPLHVICRSDTFEVPISQFATTSESLHNPSYDACEK